MWTDAGLNKDISERVHMEANDYRDRDSREYRDRDSKEYREPREYKESRERCAVAGFCDGLCREQHLIEDGRRCPAWYTDDSSRRRSAGAGRPRRSEQD